MATRTLVTASVRACRYVMTATAAQKLLTTLATTSDDLAQDTCTKMSAFTVGDTTQRRRAIGSAHHQEACSAPCRASSSYLHALLVLDDHDAFSALLVALDVSSACLDCCS